jgi:hypothetical protein
MLEESLWDDEASQGGEVSLSSFFLRRRAMCSEVKLSL